MIALDGPVTVAILTKILYNNFMFTCHCIHSHNNDNDVYVFLFFFFAPSVQLQLLVHCTL